MFGLSKKETLMKAVLNACENNIGVYKDAIGQAMKRRNSATESELRQMAFIARRDYFDAVFNSVYNSFQVSSPAICTKIGLVMMSPAMCGYPDIDIDNGIGAGSVYAICYYAMTNKTASPGECIALNHEQNNIMDAAIRSLEQ